MKLEAARRLLLADGSWFYSLTDDMQEQYVKEHPDSKYAKGWRRKGHQSKQPSRQKWFDSLSDYQKQQFIKENPKSPQAVQQQKKPAPLPKQPGGTPKAKQAIKKLPAHAQQFVRSGDTQSGSKSRRKFAKAVKKQSKVIARKTLKDNVSLAKAMLSLPKILRDRGNTKDFKGVAKLGATVLASAGIAAALGVSGPAGFLTFMAIKHLAAPAMYSLMKKAATRGPVATGSDVKHESSKAWAATGNKGISAYGYWKDADTWVSETQEEWEAHYEDEDRQGRPPKTRHAAVEALIVAASEEAVDEELMQSIIETFADYAASGDIPDDSWDAAVEEMAASNPQDAVS